MKHRFFIICMSVLLALTLCGCNSDYMNEVKEFAMIADHDDLSALEQYPNLEYVDLRGSTCYDAIIQYISEHPEIRVRYNVNLGNVKVNNDVPDITLYPNDFDFQTLLLNLKYLPQLQKIHFIHMPLSPDQLNELKTTYPDLDVNYDIIFAGRDFTKTANEIDLTFLESQQIGEAISLLRMLPNISKVYLSSADVTGKLVPADVKLLVDAFPDIDFYYSFRLFGQEISTADVQLIFDEVQIGNEGLSQIREALDIMKHCELVILDSCGIDDVNMESLRKEYPGKDIVWRIFVNRYSLLTNEEMIRMPSGVTDKNIMPLKYCTNVKYLDLSGNKVSDFSFLSNFTELECAILTLTNIRDLTPLLNSKNLTWLELYSCSKIEDFSPIAQMKNLKYLNLSKTKISDISPLNQLSLERFVCVDSKISDDGLQQFSIQNPNCLVSNSGSALGYAWRFNDKRQKEPFEYYEKMSQVFRYNDRYYFGNRKEK